MLRETVTNCDPSWGELVDIDVLDSGHWAGLFRNDGRLFVRTFYGCIHLQDKPKYPRIRCVDHERVVVANIDTYNKKANVWILSTANGYSHSFFAGDAIQDVLAGTDTIVVTYFDEGIFSGIAPSDQGIAVFGETGDLRTGYMTYFGRNAVDIADCYAACWDTDSRIVFLPYAGFELVKWDLVTGEQTVTATPPRVHGSSAISTCGDETLFFGPYNEKRAIFEWKPGREPVVIGSYSGPLRGLRGGRFLTHGTSGFTIVEVAR